VGAAKVGGVVEQRVSQSGRPNGGRGGKKELSSSWSKARKLATIKANRKKVPEDRRRTDGVGCRLVPKKRTGSCG